MNLGGIDSDETNLLLGADVELDSQRVAVGDLGDLPLIVRARLTAAATSESPDEQDYQGYRDGGPE